jgi:hypothetical protein
VTVAVRRGGIPYCQPPRPRSLLERIQAPETGLGTGWRSVACVAAPMLFYQMPRDFRHLVVRKHLGPAPGWVSREEVEQNVNVLLGAKVDRACVRGDVASVTFRTGDGTEKTIDAEHVISATGFRVDMQRLNFITPRIMDRLALADQTPLLSPHFETSVPGLFMVGIAAANNFGPLLRFAYGAGFTSDRLSRFLHQTTVRHSVAVKRNLTAA